MDGGDLAVTYADRLVNDFHHRRETVGGAGGRRQQSMLWRVVELVIDADHNVERAAVLDRSRDDHALGAAIEITLQLLLLEEFAGAFEHDIAAKIAPRNLGWRCRLAKAEPLVRDRDGLAAIDANRRVPAAMQTVELQQMGRRFDAALQFVDMNDIKPVTGTGIAIRPIDAAKCGSQGKPPNAAHAVDANSHRVFLLGENLGRIADFVQPRLERHPVQRLEGKAGENLDAAPDHRVKLVQQGRPFGRRALELRRIGQGPGGGDILAREIGAELPMRHVAQAR